MTEVRFKVRFMDWRKGDKDQLRNQLADKYIAMGVCDKAKPPVRRKRRTAPANKMVAGAANK